ncbi:MAG: hypothetical protein ACI4U3_01870 [Traorella sp.]
MKYQLDYSAFLHCATMNQDYLNTFRLQAILKKNIDPKLLQKVLDSLIDQFPTICCRITKNKFWYFVEPLEHLQIQKDNQEPFQYLTIETIFKEALVILYSNKMIGMEIFHSVTDGYGAFIFFTELLRRYINIAHNHVSECKMINMSIEDRFSTLQINQRYKKKEHSNKLFKFSKRNKQEKILFTTFVCDIEIIKQKAKQFNCSVNELILTIFAKSIERINDDHTNSICLSSPINLRNIFSLNTLRNFTLCAPVYIENNLSYSALTNTIKKQMEEYKTSTYHNQEIYQMQQVYHNPFIKYCPLAIKKKIVQLVYKQIGEKSCITISNMGMVLKDEPFISQYIESLDLILSPRYSTPNNCGIIAFNDELHITVTHDRYQKKFLDSLKMEFDKLEINYTEISKDDSKSWEAFV